jgi:hypothetical protein
MVGKHTHVPLLFTREAKALKIFTQRFSAEAKNNVRTYFTAGLPDGIFSNQNPYLGTFWRVLQWRSWYILPAYGLFCVFYGHFIYFSCFGMLYQEKSGNPALQCIGNHPMNNESNDDILLIFLDSFTTFFSSAFHCC